MAGDQREFRVLDRVGVTTGEEGGAALAFAEPTRARTRGWALLMRRRWQLLGGLVFGLAVPTVLTANLHSIAAAWLPSVPDGGFSASNTLIGATLAMLFGFVTFRQLRNHPSADAVSYIFYPFAMSFGMLAVAFLMVRIQYSRWQLIASFVGTVAWFVFVHLATRASQVNRMAVVPSGAYPVLPRAKGVLWLPLKSPSLEGLGVTGVVADLRADHDPVWERFLARCALAGLPVFDTKQITESLTGRVDIEHPSENTLSANLYGLVYARLKRGFDIAGVAIAAVPFAAITLLAAVMIRLEGRGPIFFRQDRVGYRGKVFTIWKLRSMWPETNGEAGRRFTGENDDRVTRVGRLIRRYRIDEFPQIWNILKGDMSWIGPRPEAQELAEWYEREVPYYSYRHMVRPGLTGWAQVNQGNVAEIDAATEKLQYDFYYIKHFSPWLDLLVVLKTIRTVATGFGAR